MEAPLDSGINIGTLKREWDEFRSLPFPKNPKEDNLGELFVDLALDDGHVAGIVSSFLQGVKVEKKLIHINEDLNKNLLSYKPFDSESKKSQERLIEYKNRLDRLVKLVLDLYDKY